MQKMQTYGDLQEFYVKWWKYEGKCPVLDEKAGSTAELTIGKIGGIFVVVAFGLFLAVIVVILEFIWKAKSVSKNMV